MLGENQLSLKQYIRLLIICTSRRLAAAYKYLLTPPSLEAVAEYEIRRKFILERVSFHTELLQTHLEYEEDRGNKRRRNQRGRTSRKRRVQLSASFLEKPVDGWNFQNDEANGIYFARRVDSLDAVNCSDILQSSTFGDTMMCPDEDSITLNYTDMSITTEMYGDDANSEANSEANQPVNTSTLDVASIEKIRRLEEELAKLKESLILMRPPPPPPSDGDVKSPISHLRPLPACPLSPIEFKRDSIPVPPASNKIPLPPPPPSLTKSTSTILKLPKPQALKPVTNTASLSDICAGVKGKVLRPTAGVKRSPGGTPLKDNSPSKSGDNFLVSALKRKFKKVNGDNSPASPVAPPAEEKENVSLALSPVFSETATARGFMSPVVSDSEWDEMSLERE